MSRSEFRTNLLAAVAGVGVVFASVAAVVALVDTDRAERQGIPGKTAKGDLSPLPNYKGTYVSLGSDGHWRKPITKDEGFVYAAAAKESDPVEVPKLVDKPPEQNQTGVPEANCSVESIVYYADQAPYVFDPAKRGLLYGVKTHTKATRVEDMPGFNSCALVVHAILKKAGCKWAKYTADAKQMYDLAWEQGWRPSKVQKAGCLVAWNSIEEGWRPRIGKGDHVNPDKKKGVKFRHLGISTGDWMTIDNTSYFSRPTPGITYRPIRYEPPLYLCPTDKKTDELSATK